MRELLPQYTGGIALKLVSVVLRRVHWRDSNKEMNAVGHNFQTFNLYVQSRCFLVKQFLEACFYGVHQYRFAVLRQRAKITALNLGSF